MPSRRYSAGVGATSTTVRPSGRRARLASGRCAARRHPGRARPGPPRRCPGAVWSRRTRQRVHAGRGEARRRSGRSRAACRRSRPSAAAGGCGRRRVTNSASMPPDLLAREASTPRAARRTARSRPSPPSRVAQRPDASQVQATARPRPYCHCASSGSSRPGDEHALGGRLDGRAVVAQQLRQARRRGRAGWASRPSGPGRRAPRRSAGPDACCVSLRKMSGMLAGFAAGQ